VKPFPLRALKSWNDGRFAPHVVAFGGGGTTSTNTIQNTSPWTGQQPYILGGFTGGTYAPGGNGTIINSPAGQGAPGTYGAANALYTGYTPQYYPTSTYAPIGADQQTQMGNILSFTGAGGSSSLGAANSSLASMLSPNYTAQTQGTFNQGTNALGNELSSGYLNSSTPSNSVFNTETQSSYLDPANSPTYRTAISNALASALPSVTASFANGNRSNSGLETAAATSAAANAAGGLAQQQYQANQGIQNQAAGQEQQQYQANQTIQNSAAQQASNNLLTQQGNQVKGALVAPSIDTTQLGNLNAGLQTAGMEQQNSQNAINAEVARWNYGQMLPWNMLGMYQNAITGSGNPGASTQSQTQTPYFSNPTANILGGTTAALGLASAGAQAAGYSGLALGGDSLLGALFSGAAFSDRRLKTDIEKIGDTDSGFPLYLFRYRGESPMSRHLGLMAQDVEKKRPEAVIHTPYGMMVDYFQALAA
jgi:hypothetical protein